MRKLCNSMRRDIRRNPCILFVLGLNFFVSGHASSIVLADTDDGKVEDACTDPATDITCTQRWALARFAAAAGRTVSKYNSTLAPVHSWPLENISSDPCADLWAGVHCISLNGVPRVSSISASGVALDGYFAPELSLLAHISYIDLSQNALTGTLPCNAAGLTSLRRLNLRENNLKGPLCVPEGLNQLTHLDLSANAITGTIPTALGHLTALQELHLQDNLFTNRLPLQLAGLARLVALNVSENNLTGTIPSTLSALSSLQTLHLSQNSLSGTIPRELGTLASLSSLDLHGNVHLYGSLPSALAGATGLRVLKLQGNALNGTLPSELLSALTRLESLDLSRNNLSGTLPCALGLLTNIQLLNLAENELSGTLPPALGNLTALTSLELHGNQRITGSIPPSFALLTGLQLLNLSANSLFGTNQDQLTALSKISSLWALDLSGNSFSGGLSWLEALASLSSLELQRNLFSGTLPAAFASFSSLRHLDLGQNKLQGRLPEELAKLNQITSLVLAENMLSGSIPEGYGALTGLQKLDLHNNNLEGSVPDTFKSLAQLQWLDLRQNALVGHVDTWLPWMTSMYHFAIAENQFSGTIPSMRHNPFMGVFALRRNRFSGPVPSDFHSGCFWLDLNGNRFSGTIPAALADLPYTKFFDVGDNQLTGTIPDAFGARGDTLRMTQVFNAAVNHLTGTLPANLGNISGLRRLYLNNNRLVGSIPASWGGFGAVIHLTLDGNQLTGSIPSSLPNGLRRVEHLDLSANFISGSLPVDIGNMRSLGNMLLNDNRITGPIPSSIGHIPYLQLLDLTNNQMTGTIPEALGDNANLITLKLAHNRLSGPLPESLHRLQLLEELALAENELVGGVPTIWGGMPSLRVLSAANNRLSGPLPFEWVHKLADFAAQTATHPYVAGVAEVEWTPRNISAARSVLPALQNLDLSHNQLNCSLYHAMMPLVNLQQLQRLTLDNNNLFGQMHPGVFTWDQVLPHDNLTPDMHLGFKSLHSLDISHNKLSSDIRCFFKGCFPAMLQWLNLHDNQLTGKIPEGALGISSLDVSSNYMQDPKGELPGFLMRDSSEVKSYPDFRLLCHKIKGVASNQVVELDPAYDGFRRCMCVAGHGFPPNATGGECAPCPANTFRAESWHPAAPLSCIPCPNNTHTEINLVGADRASNCLPDRGYERVTSPDDLQQQGQGQGFWKEAAQVLAAAPCPVGKVKPRDGAEPCTVCQFGSYSVNTTTCEECPARALCHSGTLKVPKDAWRRSPADTVLYRCAPGRCKGESQPYAGPGCAEGHRGWMCAACAEGWALQGARCFRCDDDADLAGLVVIAWVLVMVVLGIGAYTFMPFIRLNASMRLKRRTFQNEDLSGSRTDSRDDRSNWADGENVIKVGGTHQQATTQRRFLDKRSSFAMVMERMAVTERIREFLVRQEFWNWWIIRVLFSEMADNITNLAEKGFTLGSMAAEIFANLLSYLQIVQTFNLFYEIAWPSQLSFVFNMGELAALAISSMPSVSCVFRNMGYYQEFSLWMFTPAAIVALVIPLNAYLPRHIFWSHAEVVMFQTCVTKLILFMSFLLYIPLSQKTMSIFSCREIYGDYYLTMALEEQCYTNEHFKYLVVGCICSLLYPLGIPLVYYLILVRLGIPAIVEMKTNMHLLHMVMVNFTSKELTGMPAHQELDNYTTEDIRIVHQALLVDKTANYVTDYVPLAEAIRRTESQDAESQGVSFRQFSGTEYTSSSPTFVQAPHYPAYTTYNSTESRDEYPAGGNVQDSDLQLHQKFPLDASNEISVLADELLDDALAGGPSATQIFPMECRSPSVCSIRSDAGFTSMLTRLHRTKTGNMGARPASIQKRTAMIHDICAYAKTQKTLVNSVDVRWSLHAGVEKHHLKQYQRREKYALLMSSFLFAEYKPRFWWWEVLECCRKFILTSAMLFVEPGSATQIILSCLFNAFVVVVYLYWVPVGSVIMFHLKALLAALLAFFFFVGLGIHTDTMTSDVWSYALVSANLLMIIIPSLVGIFLVSYSLYPMLAGWFTFGNPSTDSVDGQRSFSTYTDEEEAEWGQMPFEEEDGMYSISEVDSGIVRDPNQIELACQMPTHSGAHPAYDVDETAHGSYSGGGSSTMSSISIQDIQPNAQ